LRAAEESSSLAADKPAAAQEIGQEWTAAKPAARKAQTPTPPAPTGLPRQPLSRPPLPRPEARKPKERPREISVIEIRGQGAPAEVSAEQERPRLVARVSENKPRKSADRGVRVFRRNRTSETLAAIGLFIRRLGSGMVDVLIWLTMGLGLYKATALVSGFHSFHGTLAEWIGLVLLPLAFMVIILALVYGGLFGYIAGRTPGMMMFGLRMTDARGRKPALTQAVVRTGLFLALALPLGLGFLVFLKGSLADNAYDRFTGIRVERA
jgi:uncharacterized RDD family membrane protein YckC